MVRKKKEVKEMSDLGVYAAKFKTNHHSLEEFDNSLSFFRGKEEITTSPKITSFIDKLLTVLEPITENIQGRLSASMAISEHSIIDIIRERHSTEWQTYKEELIMLKLKLMQKKFTLTKKDFDILNDIADALDSECASLFRRMSER